MQSCYKKRFAVILVFLCTIFSAIPAHADKNFIYESVRTLGMGGTSVALADDHQALFTNPAGLGLQKESSYSVLNAMIKQNEDYSKVNGKIKSLSDDDTATSRAANFNNLMSVMGETGYQAWSAMAYYMGATGFGMAAYYHDSERFSVENPANPLVKSEVYQDAVLTGSIARGFNESQILFKDRTIGWWGTTMKVATRKMTEQSFYARDFAALTPGALKDTDRSGATLDFDLGALWQLNNPWQSSLGLFVGNVLSTDYSEEAGTLERQFAIGTSIKPLTGPPERNEKLVLAADYWENGDDRTALTKLRLGMQVELAEGIHFLCGLRGGYPTAGLAVKWYDLQVQAATYGEELGQRPGEKEDRRYTASFNLEF
ncbi:MAG: hypothetical protein CVV42_16450 [Candidatus Riflebacteria bacterium HGW-Riflebacteria-2]|jgi:hypothetical protein|nr:MAG: hypothetical protein CVV42_16450 [Candidatus Riflebacteria bacterium HGW-Riflebacteria-2]